MNISELNEKFNALSLRERVIVLFAALLLVYGVWYFVWFYAAENRRDALAIDAASLETRAASLQTEIQTFQALATNQVYQNKRDEIARAEARLAELDTELAQLSQGLVEPGQLAKVIRDLLREASRVELMELTTEPARLIPISSSNEQDEVTSGVYRHTLQITLTGGYFEILDLVARLENLEWAFYWESLDYEVEAYPKATVTIRLFTLSAQEGRMGV
ncbi:hypothetical protein QWI17_20215 [Gilvimarinus sp. SDUM040013]|uniref:MSHA biogenesis protein MshJ n=1 Tax=Gilvimarinus gilvus TaxID=3058038 RepID=A0ABU4RS80_9GAMM|nr:hypothetical protein [Gilvimarinus sp. SDUM040013]MDO3388182.1 hypothetical protein [Gilvimarinus sp. SDUM040013]MDX6847732.1 hypothetical protein [Gilvimarinus sp. SDUM040013]